MTVVTIRELGAKGEGVAVVDGAPLHVPFTLHGETANVALDPKRSMLIAILEPSPDRIAPVCRHFEACGGCALQHMAQGAYRAWKVGLVEVALRRQGIDAPVEQGWFCEPASRRRAAFTAKITDGVLRFGFNRAMSHEVIDIAECPVLTPGLFAARAKLAPMLNAILPRDIAVVATVIETREGLDVSMIGKFSLDEHRRRIAAEATLKAGLARLSVNREIVLEPRRPTVDFGGAVVCPPPGAFLQAVPEAEAFMAALVTGHLAKAKRVADLYSGCGTFALRLARTATVHAVEDDAGALAALDRGWRDSGGTLKQVTTERRDLARRPLTAAELKPFAGVVFDPPRTGAEAQARELAKSAVRSIAAVSCNPATLARDLAILVAGGYRVVSVTPVDQFLWTPHVEAVALLER